MSFFRFFVSGLLISILFFSCQTGKSSTRAEHNNLYATHFKLQHYKNYSILHIFQAWKNGDDFTYVLSKSGTKIPDSLKEYRKINVPLQNIIVTSTTHLPFLEALNETNKLLAFPNTKYVSSPRIRSRIDSGFIKEIGYGMQLNTEAVLELKPQLLMVFSSGSDVRNYQVFQQNKIPVLYNADWMEATPLGRAEWIKVFGALFDKEQLADSVFKKIEANYLHIKTRINNSKQKPLVFQGGKFGDKWYVPGGKSYAAQLISDAGGLYVWQSNYETGSFPLNYENALLKLSDASIWLNPGMIENKEQLVAEIPEVKDVKPFRASQIFTYNLTRGTTGGVTYFEYSGLHPDWVLSDLYHIFYTSSAPYHFHFYKKLPE